MLVTDRRRQLERLRDDLASLRQALAQVHAETKRLGDIETARPLNCEEARCAASVRRDSERLYWELETLRREFARLQEEGQLQATQSEHRGNYSTDSFMVTR